MSCRFLAAAALAVTAVAGPAYADPQAGLSADASDVFCSTTTACVHFSGAVVAAYRLGEDGAKQDSVFACTATAPGAASVTVRCSVLDVAAPEYAAAGPVATTHAYVDLMQEYGVTICYSATVAYDAAEPMSTPTLCSEHSSTIGM